LIFTAYSNVSSRRFVMKYGILMALAMFMVGSSTPLTGQAMTILGQVTDRRTGEPLAVGLVSVKGTELSDRLRPDGVFVLEVPTFPVTLVVSSLGYRTEEVQLAPFQKVVKVDLDVDALELERLVVTGRATEMERRHLANAVAALGEDRINMIPAGVLEETLHGKVAGLQIKQSSAAPGGGNMLRLRGISSIFGPAGPLYVLDGVIVSDARMDIGMNAISLAEGTDVIAAARHDGIPNRIADLNPNDIASIEILRGAAATVMYGSRGARGVVVIKTKRGGGG
jgi:TonB-dependent SusC/RagA subfamily outer membrane receptor